jgi:hypothetical protein
MSTQNRDNFQWRPNDNSVTTNLRYDLEMNHWLKSFKSSTVSSTFKFSSSFIVIGLIFSLSINLIFFILICLSDFIVWVVDKIKKREVGITKPKIPPTLSKERLDKMFNTKNIYENTS